MKSYLDRISESYLEEIGLPPYLPSSLLAVRWLGAEEFLPGSHDVVNVVVDGEGFNVLVSRAWHHTICDQVGLCSRSERVFGGYISTEEGKTTFFPQSGILPSIPPGWVDRVLEVLVAELGVPISRGPAE